jgi:hypothetical protein
VEQPDLRVVAQLVRKVQRELRGQPVLRVVEQQARKVHLVQTVHEVKREQLDRQR